MNHYEAKQEARRARYEELARKADHQASADSQRAHDMAQVIPFGQPVLVGHHSEGRDRRYRARIGQTMDRAIEASKKADYYREKAAGVGSAGVSGDDPEAIQKLELELSTMRRLQDRMKKANRVIRANLDKGRDAQVSALIDVGFEPAEAEAIMTPNCYGGVGFERYQLSNNNANMKRIELRIKELRAIAELVTVERQGDGFTYREDTEENRVMFIFEGKPDADMRERLKGRGFKWSPTRGAWVRQMTANGLASGRRLLRELQAP